MSLRIQVAAAQTKRFFCLFSRQGSYEAKTSLGSFKDSCRNKMQCISQLLSALLKNVILSSRTSNGLINVPSPASFSFVSLHFKLFVFFPIYLKNKNVVDFSRIKTCIVDAEGEHASHLPATTAKMFGDLTASCSFSCHPQATDKKVSQLSVWVLVRNFKLQIGKNFPVSFTDKEVF